MKLAIVGSRSFKDFSRAAKRVASLLELFEVTAIVSGGAQGADKIAEQIADLLDLKKIIFRPDWDQYGYAAGHIRNTEIILEADIVLVFWDGKSKGTVDSIKKARKKGCPLFIERF